MFYWCRIYFEKPNIEIRNVFLKKVKEKTWSEKIVIEHFWYRKSYFTVHAHIHETKTAETPIECIYLCESIAVGCQSPLSMQVSRCVYQSCKRASPWSPNSTWDRHLSWSPINARKSNLLSGSSWGVTRGKRGHNSPGAERLRGGGRQKVATMSQVLSSTAHLLPKHLKFEHWGGAKLVFCPGRHLTLLRPWSQNMRNCGLSKKRNYTGIAAGTQSYHTQNSNHLDQTLA